MATLPPVNRDHHLLPEQRSRNGLQTAALNQWQVGWQDEPPIGARCFLHSGGDRVAHAGVLFIFKMPRQSAATYRVQRMLQNSFAQQPRLQFVRGPARRRESFAPAGGQNDDGRHRRGGVCWLQGSADVLFICASLWSINLIIDGKNVITMGRFDGFLAVTATVPSLACMGLVAARKETRLLWRWHDSCESIGVHSCKGRRKVAAAIEPTC